jgi:hypothetical protein
MEALKPEFEKKLKEIGKAIQDSEELATYLEEEGDEEYQSLRERFDPPIQDLHEHVTIHFPLQIIPLEKALLDPVFEGLYLPRILGYSVLRGEIDDNFKYKRPQPHFKDILLAIAASSNFDILKNRIGQAIQIGFALSSDIWITNLLQEVVVNQVENYLKAQKLPRYHNPDERRRGYLRFAKQFQNSHYMSADFPESKEEFLFLFSQMKRFLLHRVNRYEDNSNLLNKVLSILNEKSYRRTPEYVQLLAIVANFFDLDGKQKKEVAEILNQQRTENPDFLEHYLRFVHELLVSGVRLSFAEDQRFIQLLDKDINDDLSKYYQVLKEIDEKGYVHEDAINAVKKFYYQHEGMSLINECLRLNLLRHFERFLTNLSEEEYHEYFEFTKVFTMYIQIFSNQQFNQSIKEACLRYVRKLIKFYPDKRGKDYQDIKKFVSTTFLDLGFMTEKQIVELFKSRRKRRTAKA